MNLHPRRRLALKLARRQRHRCLYCRARMTDPPSRLPTCRTIDHKTPLSRGGPDEPGNMAACCLRCNETKGDMTAEEFLAVRPRRGDWCRWGRWKRRERERAGKLACVVREGVVA